MKLGITNISTKFADKRQYKVLYRNDNIDGLVGYWTMNASDIDFEANTIHERSGNGNHGILSNVTSVPGRYGEALLFNGSASKIEIVGSQSLNMRVTNHCTYSVWFKLSTAPVGWKTLIAHKNSQELSLNSGIISFYPGTSENYQVAVYSPTTPLTSGTWFNIIAVYDGTIGKIYLNGVLQSLTTFGQPGGVMSSVSNFTIGKSDFQGEFDEVRIYNRAFTNKEAIELYTSTSFPTEDLPVPAVSLGFQSTTQDLNSITLSWTPNQDASEYLIYGNNTLVTEIGADISTTIVPNLSQATTYSFELVARNQYHLDSPSTDTLQVNTLGSVPTPVIVTNVQYLSSQPQPIFKVGHTLPPLTRWAWNLDDATNIALADWGYTLDLYDADDTTVASLSNPASSKSQLVDLAISDPDRYKLSVNVPRVPTELIPSSAYTINLSGQPTTSFSPECPDNVLQDMATYLTDRLSAIQSYAPLTVVLNGGERYMGVYGNSAGDWQNDSSVMTAKGDLSWGEYQSQRKAHQEMIFATSIRNSISAIYIWYHAGGNPDRSQFTSSWYLWDYDYGEMHPITDFPNSSMYYGEFNNGWTGHLNWTGNVATSNSDILSLALNAYGYASTFNNKLSYNWVCAGWSTYGHGDIERYYGFLKSYYTAGMIGGIAGYFNLPTGGFDASFDINHPPHWLQQIETLTHVHGRFSYLEDMLRNGDLLPGPYMNEKNPDQPCYEFWTDHADTRVLARKSNGSKRWLISVWAADNVRRSVDVEIPILGLVQLNATPAGTLYDARIVDGVVNITILDNGSLGPLILDIPATTPDID